MTKKILFIGMPDMATVCLNKLLSDGLNIEAVVLCDKSNPARVTISNIAAQNNIKILEYEKTPNEPDFINKIKTLNFDIGVICSFNHKLSKEFLSLAPDGFINCHPSLLPNFRGANPYFHIINSGEKISGITLHFADEHFDTGNIIAQEHFPLLTNETMGMLFSRTNFMMAELLSKTLLQYSKTGQIDSTPQPEGTYPTAPNVPGDIYINWADNILKTERLIRAANPFYNALTNFRGGYIRIIEGVYEIKRHSKPFGTIAKVKKDYLKIASNGGFYLPNVIQAGAWGIYSIKEFIEKFNPKENEILK